MQFTKWPTKNITTYEDGSKEDTVYKNNTFIDSKISMGTLNKHKPIN